MSGQHKHQQKPKPAEPTPSHAPLAGKIFDEHKPVLPPAAKKIIECVKCFYGQDVSRGYRLCRGGRPGALYRNTVGEQTHAAALWARVEDHDYCKDGEPL